MKKLAIVALLLTPALASADYYSDQQELQILRNIEQNQENYQRQQKQQYDQQQQQQLQEQQQFDRSNQQYNATHGWRY
ncbi:MAG: hypothetical protein WAW61_05010 [Methylococcaceae bacterium]